jgi:hypothetical protein
MTYTHAEPKDKWGGEHVRHPETGCPLPALSAEVARADDKVRAAFDDGLREVHIELDRVVGSPGKGLGIDCQTVGAVMLARATLHDHPLDQQPAQRASAGETSDSRWALNANGLLSHGCSTAGRERRSQGRLRRASRSLTRLVDCSAVSATSGGTSRVHCGSS